MSTQMSPLGLPTEYPVSTRRLLFTNFEALNALLGMEIARHVGVRSSSALPPQDEARLNHALTALLRSVQVGEWRGGWREGGLGRVLTWYPPPGRVLKGSRFELTHSAASLGPGRRMEGGRRSRGTHPRVIKG